MPRARIYKPAKTAMSSGRAGTHAWLLEFDPESPRAIEPLMGYTASADMRSQVQLRFDSKEEAIAYAQRNDIDYRVVEAPRQKRRLMSYADNFRSDRETPWTH